MEEWQPEKMYGEEKTEQKRGRREVGRWGYIYDFYALILLFLYSRKITGMGR